VLFHYDKESDSVEMRHFCIRAAPVAVSKPVKRVLLSNSKALPDLGHLADISDWLLGGGAGDAGDLSESEAEDEGSRVVLPQKLRGRGNISGQTSAVKLSEVGPRLTMHLFKVERGLCEGDVMYHSLESKTPAEVSMQRAHKAEAEGLKRKRREEQEANVSRKQDAEEVKRAAKKGRREAREATLAAAQTQAAFGGLGTTKQAEGASDDEGGGDDDE
jgi:ribosome biogenesis protein SSF1/2